MRFYDKMTTINNLVFTKRRTMNNSVSPSIMCADFLDLGETLKIFEAENIEYIHTDIMDGSFVPNFTLGTDFCRMLKERTRIPIDLHLMIDSPEKKLGWFSFGEGDIVSIHFESTPNIRKALDLIKERGAEPFIALNPATPISVLDEFCDIISGVVIMAVNPGFAGQKMIPSTIRHP